MVRAFQAISMMYCRSFHHLNQALITLLPKVDIPEGLGDYRPISLIHIFGKIFAKILADRFTPTLPHLMKRPQIFGEENPSPCTFAIVPGSVAIAYRSHHRRLITTVHRITQILVHNLLHVHNGVQHYKPQG
jgi:hypothetical protein